ncbi:MAG: replication initiation protein [Sulfurovum sp.]|nr:replication initiation protein [Sulfurovum sp.]
MMNKNTITFGTLIIDVPKLTSDQYLLLRQVLVSIENKNLQNNSYYITSNTFSHLPLLKLQNLLKANVKISFSDNSLKEWYSTDIVSDIRILDDKIFFRPSNMLHEIAVKSKISSKHSYLQYLLFNGIRFKYSLVFLDFLAKQKGTFVITVKNLKKMLGIEEHKYKNYNAFKKYVILRILDDVNTKTAYDLSVETSTSNNGKKVISLTFTFFNKGLKDV